ncbi:MAG TPA: glutaredoxin domain-containing protein [Myxococcaceae bacterium]|nr:glutaredoxin domain-containing protein [Myxococcaceae bacterium]
MVAVTLFVRREDPRCVRARNLLQRRGARLTLVDVTDSPERLAEMIARSGGQRAPPQIFLDGRYLGGLDELIDMEERGALEWVLDGGQSSGVGAPSA